MTARSLAALALALPLLAACGQDEEGSTIRVLAASSLTDVFTDLAEEFEAAHDGVDVQLSFGSSTDLAEQAADGAPADVLATADEQAMRIAADAGAVGPPVTFAASQLVIVTPPDNPAGIHELADLAGTTWVRCADEVPCGKVARSLLDLHGVTAQPASLEEDARSTLEKVAAGEADAALVYAPDAIAAGDRVQTLAIPDSDRFRALYLMAVLEQGNERVLAREWSELVTGGRGDGVLTDAGFTLQ